MAVLSRTCKLCGEAFVHPGYWTGRPRDYCWVCEPPGFKVVLSKHRFGRVKLRRINQQSEVS